MEPPSLPFALALAHLLQKRCSAAVAQAQHKCNELGEEVEQLRREAAEPPAPQSPQPPLQQLIAGDEGIMPTGVPDTSSEALQRQQQSLGLWLQAAAVLPPDIRPMLARTQRYLLLCEVQQASSGLPLCSLLERTPVRAMLELAAEVLHTHASAAEQGPAGPPLSEAHGQLLAAACACLAQLCDGPGNTALDSDYEALQRFYDLVLQMAAAPPPEPPIAAVLVDAHGLQPEQGTAGDVAISQPKAAAAGMDMRQATCQLAQQVLSVLRQSPSAGTVLLSCTAPQTRDCMAALVAAITGEQVMSTDLAGSAGGMLSAQQAAEVADVGPAEEARLLHAFTQLSQQLSAGLRLLPQWMRTMGLHNDAFMQDMAGAILSARDASELIAVTHPSVARQMQRVAAQMVGALQTIAGDASAGTHHHDGA